MINKLNLSDKFELIVKQEIKNYQDSLEYILKSVRYLKESIDDIKIKSQESYEKLHNQYKALDIEIKDIKKSHKELNQSFVSQLNDQRKINEINSCDIKDFSDYIERKLERDNDFEEKLAVLREYIIETRSLVEKNFTTLNVVAENLREKINKDLLRTKKEILDAPTEATLVKKHLEDKINSHKVDVYGILRELNIYRKENHITQKKIEHLYILIDRLKNAEGSL